MWGSCSSGKTFEPWKSDISEGSQDSNKMCYQHSQQFQKTLGLYSNNRGQSNNWHHIVGSPQKQTKTISFKLLERSNLTRLFMFSVINRKALKSLHASVWTCMTVYFQRSALTILFFFYSRILSHNKIHALRNGSFFGLHALVKLWVVYCFNGMIKFLLILQKSHAVKFIRDKKEG